MIILKLNIQPVSKERLKYVNLRIRKRDFREDLSEENLQWIENIQGHGFGNVVIKDIHTDGSITTYLDVDKQRLYPEKPIPVSRKELEDYVKRLSDYIKTLKEKKKELQDKDVQQAVIDKIDELSKRLRNKLSGLRKTLKNNREPNLRIPCRKVGRLGYYTRYGRNAQPNVRTPEVVLFMDRIGKDNSLLVSTYIHEMFHAYYDLDWLTLSQQDLGQTNSKYPEYEDLKYIEEPLTEYAMLKFLEDFAGHDQDRNDVLNKVSEFISKKRLNPSICHYGLGYYLWKWEKNGGKLPNWNWIQKYKNVKSKGKLLDYKFIDPFKKGLYPFGGELQYMALLYKLIAEADDQQVIDVATIETKLENQKIQVF